MDKREWELIKQEYLKPAKKKEAEKERKGFTIIFFSNTSKLKKPFQQNKNNYFITKSTNYLKPHRYRYYYQKHLHSLNLPKLTFHSLRHTFATQAIELGIDCKTVSEILGHASMNATLNLYVHPKTEYKRKCLDLIYQNLKNR